MQKVLISLPDNLAYRFRLAIPPRQRSKVLTNLITEEVDRREHNLYKCALEIEKDEALNKEMKAWDVTLNDGLEGM